MPAWLLRRWLVLLRKSRYRTRRVRQGCGSLHDGAAWPRGGRGYAWIGLQIPLQPLIPILGSRHFPRRRRVGSMVPLLTLLLVLLPLLPLVISLVLLLLLLLPYQTPFVVALKKYH